MIGRGILKLKKGVYSNRLRTDQRVFAPAFPLLRGRLDEPSSTPPLPLPGGGGAPPLQKPKRRPGRRGEVLGKVSELWTVLRQTGQVLAVWSHC